MNRFYGVIGFSVNEKTAPGVWEPSITERPYKGDIILNSRRYENNSDSTNDNLVVNHKVSVVSDSFMDDHIGSMLYVEFEKYKWKITNVEISYPRVILTLGGVYNGGQTS